MPLSARVSELNRIHLVCKVGKMSVFEIYLKSVCVFVCKVGKMSECSLFSTHTITNPDESSDPHVISENRVQIENEHDEPILKLFSDSLGVNPVPRKSPKCGIVCVCLCV